MQKANLTTRLIKAQGALGHALKNKEILETLTELGYDSEKLKLALELSKEVRVLAEAKQSDFNQKAEAVNRFNKALDIAVEKYIFALKLARVVFKDSTSAYKTLALGTVPKKGFAIWLSQAEPFYNALLNDAELLTEISAYGLTREIIQANQVEMQELINQNNSFSHQKKETEDAAKFRKKKIAELDSFMSGLTKICQQTFAERPEVLIRLGMTLKQPE